MTTPKPCRADECGRKHHAGGFCKPHYLQHRRAITPPTPRPDCTIEGCRLPIAGRGWCSTHYSRWRRWGDPHLTGKLPAGELTYLRALVGIPADGPTDEQRALWKRQEAAA